MGFDQKKVEELLVLTGRRCCICSSLHNVQLHHIVPDDDSIDNAIPLCPTCHDQVHASIATGRTSRSYSPRELKMHRTRTINLVMGSRIIRPSIYDHFYTISNAEKERAIHDLGYIDEGIACYVYSADAPKRRPLYRLWNNIACDHFYTLSKKERDAAIKHYGYSDEGVACHVPMASVPCTIPLFRLFHAAMQDHFYGTSEIECQDRISDGYTLENRSIHVFKKHYAGTVPLHRLFRRA